jgi:hypothetical protein
MHATPEAAVQAVIDAANREDWRAAAQQCDPDSLQLFREYWVSQFAPGGPHPVADLLTAYFADVSTPEDLFELEPVEVFARYLEGHSLRRQIRRLARERELPAETLAAIDAEPPFQHFPGPIGAVPVGHEFAWVLCAMFDPVDETSFPGGAPPWASLPESTQRLVRWNAQPVRLMRTRRGPDGSWRVVAGDNFFSWPISVELRLPGEG